MKFLDALKENERQESVLLCQAQGGDEDQGERCHLQRVSSGSLEEARGASDKVICLIPFQRWQDLRAS